MEAGAPDRDRAEGERVTPSVVAITNSGERLVGRFARRQAVTNPENTVFSVKRFIGRKYTDPAVERDKKLVPYQIKAADNGDIQVKLNVEVDKVSGSAEQKIVAAGGSVK